MLIVDGANVMGARPDGWWRDRAAGAARLMSEIGDALESGRLEGPVVVVLEGAARSAPEPRSVDGLSVVRAERSGDDTVVAVAAEAFSGGHEATVVTADRALRGRVQALGVSVLAPRRLLASL